MFKFIRTIDKSLEDFLVFNLKTLGNLVDNVDDHSPYTFRYGKFMEIIFLHSKRLNKTLQGK